LHATTFESAFKDVGFFTDMLIPRSGGQSGCHIRSWIDPDFPDIAQQED